MSTDIRDLIKPGGFPLDEVLAALRNHMPSIMKPQHDALMSRLDAIEARLTNIEKKISKA